MAGIIGIKKNIYSPSTGEQFSTNIKNGIFVIGFSGSVRCFVGAISGDTIHTILLGSESLYGVGLDSSAFIKLFVENNQLSIKYDYPSDGMSVSWNSILAGL